MQQGMCWKCRHALTEEDRRRRKCPNCGSVVAAVQISTPTAATVLSASPVAKTEQREETVAAPPAGTLRRYADGAFVTADGVDVASGDPGTAVPLAHKRGDVKLRIGAYDVLSELGRGGMGVVYRAFSLRLCRVVALKTMTAGNLASEADVARFQNEAMLAARLQHPHIVPVFDAGEVGGVLYFVMALVEGHGLGDLIQAQEEAPVGPERDELLRRGVKVIALAARALEFAHKRGIVHRDIKPDNILVDAEDQPHLTDFGIAKSLQRDVPLTQPGAIIGTPAYMAPEQANSLQDRIGPATDVYSLGATLYHLASGRPPYEGPSPLKILIDVMEKDPEPIRPIAKKVLARELDPALVMIIMKAMEKAAADRYASAHAFAEDLEAWLEDRPVSVHQASAGERMRKLVRRNRAAFVGGLVVIATLVLMGVGFGTVLVFNLSRTSDSLRWQDEQAGVDQTATLERAIVANMIEGRADVVRNMVDQLRKDPKLSKVEVVRTDKTLAYTDMKTMKGVEARMSNTATRAAMMARRPDMEQPTQMLMDVALRRIASSPTAVSEAPRLEVDDAMWQRVLATGEMATSVSDIDGVPHLTVMRPIKNGEACQVCHGEARAPGDPPPSLEEMYANPGAMFDPLNKTRAVLVVRRSQGEVEAVIAENGRDTMLVGLATTAGLLALIFVVVRVFGIRLRPRKFG
ncbi:MAG: protein kinase [Deltaproteobacteria bacterium]|nr:protein kinase [Deltaproteobacteria bacterium]